MAGEPRPQLWIVTGPNGAGKSTLISSLMPLNIGNGEFQDWLRDRSQGFQSLLNMSSSRIPLVEIIQKC